MAPSVFPSALATEFDQFLRASIGEESNGMLLSVLSALARLDIDPWEEAAALARLPTNAAGRRLSSLIAALPYGQLAHVDPDKIAARLIVLLPTHAGRKSPETPLHSRAAIQISFIAFVLTAQCILGIIESRLLSAKVDASSVPISAKSASHSGSAIKGEGFEAVANGWFDRPALRTGFRDERDQ